MSDVNPIRTPAGKQTRWTQVQKAGIPGDPIRQRRLNFLVRAYVHNNGDVNAMLAEIKPEKLAELIESDPWFAQEFDSSAELLLEEAVVSNLAEMALAKNAQTLPASKIILPALNKRRYNQGVQKQETANEGMGELMKVLSDKPMDRQTIVNILINNDPKLIDLKPEDMKVLTLQEAVEVEAQRGTLVLNSSIEEEEDLR